MFILLNFMIMIIFIFMSIAFFTIMERKLLGSLHIRLGPHKIGMLGLFQPFSDFLKLFFKKFVFLMKINNFFWNLSPILIFFIFILVVNFLPMKFENNKMFSNLLIFLFLIGLPTFSFFWTFFSMSKFTLISSKRCITQMLSFELGILIIMILLIPLFLKSNIYLIKMEMKSIYLKLFFFFFFFFIILCESSRIPFDFIESESELISGFNIEYSTIYFSLFFVFEYGMMLFFSLMISILFMKLISSMLLIYLFILIRASFPRFRYDQMMIFFWKNFYIFLISFLILI